MAIIGIGLVIGMSVIVVIAVRTLRSKSPKESTYNEDILDDLE